jgi:hypothetical protein
MKDRSQDAKPVLARLIQRWSALTATFKDSERLKAAETIRQHFKQILLTLEKESKNGAAPKESKTAATATAPLLPREVIEKSLLECQNNLDTESKARALQNLRFLYRQRPEKLIEDLRGYVDPQPAAEAKPASTTSNGIVGVKPGVAATPIPPAMALPDWQLSVAGAERVAATPTPTTMALHEGTIIRAVDFGLAPVLKAVKAEEW